MFIIWIHVVGGGVLCVYVCVLFFHCYSSYDSQKAMEQEEGDEEEEKETKPDPLHQLILHFSRTALTEKR